jgi:hypothetical protein
MTRTVLPLYSHRSIARAGAAIATGFATLAIVGSLIPGAANLADRGISLQNRSTDASLTARAVSNQDPPRRGDERRG